MKTCENCGSRVYGLGCVNCDEMNYIEEQEYLTQVYAAEQARDDRIAKDEEKKKGHG